jgi:type IV secretion system protein TrbI
MTENIFAPNTTAQTEPQTEPTLRRNLELPKGVLQKNLKTLVYLGAALLVIVAALFSSGGKKTPAQQASAKGQPPQPSLQDNTDNNVQELKNQLQAERQKEQQATAAAASIGDPGACRCDARAAERRRGLRPDWRGRALCSGPALPADAAGQHADATHARTTGSAANRGKRTRTG